MVRDQQIRVAWVNYAHELFALLPNTKSSDRQRSLVLAMPTDRPVPRGDLEGLTSKIAKLSAGAGPRVLSRDLNRLEGLTHHKPGAAAGERGAIGERSSCDWGYASRAVFLSRPFMVFQCRGSGR
jgi:hypothetical protein